MFDALMLGLVEGLTEFLPVSSTGHLLLVERWLGLHRSDAFNVLIQIGPILAVALVFRRTLLGMLVQWRQARVRDEIIKLCLCVAMIGIGGIVMKRLGLELPETLGPVAWALLVGAGVIFIVEALARRRPLRDDLSWTAVVAVAVGQLVSAAFPGTSRSGAAVMAALLFGVARPSAVRFAFLSGIPVMIAAGALELKDAAKQGELPQLLTLETLLAFLVATVVAFLTVVWLLRWVQTKDFRPFAWYRLVLALALLLGVVAR